MYTTSDYALNARSCTTGVCHTRLDPKTQTPTHYRCAPDSVKDTQRRGITLKRQCQEGVRTGRQDTKSQNDMTWHNFIGKKNKSTDVDMYINNPESFAVGNRTTHEAWFPLPFQSLRRNLRFRRKPEEDGRTEGEEKEGDSLSIFNLKEKGCHPVSLIFPVIPPPVPSS